MITYCTVVNTNLDIDVCPIAKLSCSYQHKLTHKCCFTPTHLNVNELANLTGNVELTNKEVSNLKAELLAKVKLSLI